MSLQWPAPTPTPTTNSTILPMQPSQAHKKSHFAIIDPVYDVTRLYPAPDVKKGVAPWVYGSSELECWRLKVLRRRAGAAKLKIGYPGEFHEPSSRATFRLNLKTGQAWPASLDLRAVGDVVVSVGDQEIYRRSTSLESHHIKFPSNITAIQSINIALSSPNDLPALLIENGPLATGRAAWHWSADGVAFSEVQEFPQTLSGPPPHRVELKEVILTPSRAGDLFDMGREVFGYIAFTAFPTDKPNLFVGESPAEARNENWRHFEQSTELKGEGNGLWVSQHPMAFRYFRITGSEPVNVQCRALFDPAQYRGAFACSDEQLTRVWMTSAYTLRLCRQDFLIDGVKRDRLPWVGDLAMSLMANAYSFGDGEIVRRSLVSLGRAGIERSHLNGIVDYSMWWVIAQDYYQRYYADEAHLNREWSRVKDTLERLEAKGSTDGLYQTAQGDWVFVDWVNEDKQTALQIVWWWALQSGAALADRMNDKSTGEAWRQRAATLKTTLLARAWDESKGAWRGRPDGTSGLSRHANIYAVVSGLAENADYPTIRAVLLDEKIKPVGTPYVAGFENIALARLGDLNGTMERVNAVWGGMLKRDATTFWEAYDSNQAGDDAYGFYDRPYAKSLCHAWSAGPAAFLTSEILGLRPLADGWKRFEVSPRLGSLQWACATVPTPHGDIEISVEAGRTTLKVPAGTTAQWREKEFVGPGVFADK